MPVNINQSDIIHTLNANNIYTPSQLEKYTKFSRFGYFDPYNTNTVTREYIFFTKMDLHLFQPGTSRLNLELKDNPFFIECAKTHKDVMNQLQLGNKNISGYSPFANLLTNTVASKLDLQDISIDNLETASNIAGTKLEYPLATTSSSNIYEFNLEFEDTKFLDVYMFFRIWYEYELLKADGAVSPPLTEADIKKNRNVSFYTVNKILHDQMSCYKIVVGEDFETIVHYSKFWGVYPTSIPRSSFGDIADGPLKIPVSFKCQWVEDMDPNILSDFNKLVEPRLKTFKDNIPIYDTKRGMINGTWCNVPHIERGKLNNRDVFKLKWR